MLPYLVLPDGSTAAQWLGPQVEQVYRTGRMPELLPGVEMPALGDGKDGKG